MNDRNPSRRLALVFLGVFAIASALFLALHHWDNKYTRTASQPIGGTLLLSAEDAAEAPCRFLIREWEYYPGVLLGPQDFAAGGSLPYRQYVSIGEYSGLEAGNPQRASHGSGTYRLTLELPEGGGIWALGMPEVFSSCRLYLGDELMMALGETSPEDYASCVQRRIIPFSGSGSVQILLQVTDYSGFYSGLVYPPAFGSLQAVETLWNLRTLLHTLILLLAMVSGGVSLYLFFRTHYRSSGLFALLCLCVAGYTCYPLLNTLLAIPVFPWYTLEAACLSGTMLLVVILQNRLTGVSRRIGRLAVGGCLLYCLFTTAAMAAAGWLSLPILKAVSLLSMGMRFCVALYLSLTAAGALRRGFQSALPLLAGSFFYAASLLWDRLLPLYEPIYGGWFPELGGLVLCCTIGCVLCADFAEAYRFWLSYSEQRRQMERQLALQQEHYRELGEQVEAARTASHDLRHHMRTLQELAEAGNYEGLREYLKLYEPRLAQNEIRTLSSRYAADAILRHYENAAESVGAKCTISFYLPRELDFPDDDLCILLGNLLENAVEATAQREPVERFVTLRGGARDGQFGFVVENSYCSKVCEQNGRFRSTKHEGFGLGIQSVRTIVERWHGIADFTGENGIFRASVLIPLKETVPAAVPEASLS